MREDHYIMFKAANGIWYYYVYRFGKRIRRSTGERRKGRAQSIIEARREAGDLLCEREKRSCVTFAEFAEPFWDYDRCPIIQDKIARGGRFSKDFAYARRLNVQKYMVPVFGKKVLPELTPAFLNRWLLSLPEKHKITPQTANKQVITLRLMLDVAVQEGIIERNPAKDVKPLVPRENARGCFSLDQVKAIFKNPWPDKFCELACRLSAMTGMRLGEVRALQRSQIHEDYIVVDRSYNNSEKIKCTKSGHSRIVPVPKELASEILSLPHDGPFAISRDGITPVHNSTISKCLRERMEKCKIDWKTEDLSFHSFRHFFNTRLIAGNIDGELARAVVGHRSEEMTDRYLHLSADDMGRIRAVQESI